MHKQWFVVCVVLIALFPGDSVNAAKQDLKRPNILWITGEDMSAQMARLLRQYKQIKTPNFDKLAKRDSCTPIVMRMLRSVRRPAVVGSRGFIRFQPGRSICAANMRRRIRWCGIRMPCGPTGIIRPISPRQTTIRPTGESRALVAVKIRALRTFSEHLGFL